MAGNHSADDSEVTCSVTSTEDAAHNNTKITPPQSSSVESRSGLAGHGTQPESLMSGPLEIHLETSHSSIFGRLPLEVLSKIILHLPFDPRLFLSLRLVCRDLAQTISLTEPGVVLSEVAQSLFPDAYAAFRLPGDHAFRGLCDLYTIHSHARSVVEHVAEHMSPEERERESSDWEDVLFKSLIVWEKFVRVCRNNYLDFYSWHKATYLSRNFSLDLHVLFRYVCARLSYCLFTTVERYASDEKYMRARGPYQFHDPRRRDQYIELSAEFDQLRPPLSDMVKILQAPHVSDDEFKRDYQSLWNLFTSRVTSLGVEERFTRFLTRHNPPPIHQAFETQMCDLPNGSYEDLERVVALTPTGTLLSPRPWLYDWDVSLYSEQNHVLRHFFTQRLIRRMFDQGNFTTELDILKFAHQHNACTGFKQRYATGFRVYRDSEGYDHYIGVIRDILNSANNDQPISADVTFGVLQECDFDAVLHEDLSSGRSVLRQSIGHIDGAFKAAMISLDAFEGELKARAILEPKHYGAFLGYQRPIMLGGFL